MTSLSSNNFIFLKDFRPELYQLCLKMEEDLLITPVSILAYSTRFLEYILYDIAKLNKYKVNTEIGFVNNIYELIQKGYLEFSFGDLLIKAYKFRNTSIHNTNIIKSIKDDKKTALELNKRLFDIAGIYYKTLTKNNENYYYTEPSLLEKSEQGFISINKQTKLFDQCIICGSLNKQSKSNFCMNCDNLLNARDVLSKILIKKEKNSPLKKDDFDYSFKKELIDYLISKEILQKVGNDYYFVNENLDDFFILTDEFMEIDKFLFDFKNKKISKPRKSEFYKKVEYTFEQVSIIVNEFYVIEIISLLKNNFSLEYSLQQIDIGKSELKFWYNSRKSEFINGKKGKIFVEFNELLIEDYFKSIEKNHPKNIPTSIINFWSQYFDKYSECKFNTFIKLLKRNYSKKDALTLLNLETNDLNILSSKNKELSKEYFNEINRRKKLILKNLKNLSLNDAVEESGLKISDLEVDRNEFLKSNENKFYQDLIEILLERYLNCRENGFCTDEICSKLTIEKSELESWLNNDLFKDYNDIYSQIRLKLFKKAISDKKSKKDIAIDLEITEDELDGYIDFGKHGIDEYVEYYDTFNKDYYPNLIESFFEEFREKSNLNVALRNSNLKKVDLEKHLNSNEELYHEFIEIKKNKIVLALIDKGKINTKLYKKLDFSKKDYQEWEEEINEKLIKKQFEIISNEVSEGYMIHYISKKFHCDEKMIFDWIFKGSLYDNRFTDLASYYWESCLEIINDQNSDIRDDVPEYVIKKILPNNLKYDFDYWKEWGLIDKKNKKLTFNNVKWILNNYYFIKNKKKSNDDI